MNKFICTITCLVWLLSCSATPSMKIQIAPAAQTSPDGPRFTPPPADEPPAIKALIDKAQLSLTSGSPEKLLSNPEYMSAHEWPRFRKLISQYAEANQVTIVTPEEPGVPLVVKGTIRNQLGEPIKGALIYVYQTSAKGWYSDKAPHVSGMSGDEKHARVFGYLTTNQDGQYEFRTIRPAGYPESNLPSHIHIEIKAAPNQPRTFISEIQFEDDPRLTREMRDRAAQERTIIVPVKREADGMLSVEANFKIQ